MPKYKPAKLCKDGKKAFVLIDRKKHYLTGQWGTPDVQAAYARYCAEWWENFQNPVSKDTLPHSPHQEHADTTLGLLVVKYLAHIEGTMAVKDFLNCKTAIFDFLLTLYSDKSLADSFTPKNLGRVRTSLSYFLVNRYFS